MTTSFVDQVRRWHRPMILLAALMAVIWVISIVGLIVDDRTVTGAPIWMKPFKFSVSFAIFALTWGWLVSLLERGQRLARVASDVVVAALGIEILIGGVQVIRGRASHFNVATPLDATLWAIMGDVITVMWVATLILSVLLLRQRIGDRAITWSIRVGAFISLIGLALGFLMTRATPDERDGTLTGLDGAHSVGVPDGGPGIPVTLWSSTGGDLRIPHFVGIHALQAIPLVALALTLLARRLPRLRPDGTRLGLVLVASGGYAALVALVTWQALRGQPLIHPDGLTLTALAVIIGAVALGVVGVLVANRPTTVEADPEPRPEPSVAGSAR